MTERWVEAVDEHRETLEKLAEDDLRLSEDARLLLDEYEEVTE